MVVGALTNFVNGDIGVHTGFRRTFDTWLNNIACSESIVLALFIFNSEALGPSIRRFVRYHGFP